jgi:hypothetical protein
LILWQHEPSVHSWIHCYLPVPAYADLLSLPITGFPSFVSAIRSSETWRRSGSGRAAEKIKKVWTNENLGEVSASAVSQVGEAKSGLPAKKSDLKPASLQEIAAYRKQLSGLQTLLANVEKQIADLKSFSKGETSGAAGMQLHKGYSTEPIEEQVRKLEEKKKSVADQIDALFDAARKRGIEPGQLR